MAIDLDQFVATVKRTGNAEVEGLYFVIGRRRRYCCFGFGQSPQVGGGGQSDRGTDGGGGGGAFTAAR